MRIISWNTRGIGQQVFKHQVKDFLSIHNPDIIIVMETRVNTNKTRKIIKRLNTYNSMDISLVCFSSGIWLLYINSVNFQL